MNDTRILKRLLIAATVGLWFIVFQNAGIIPQISPMNVKADSALRIQGVVEIENIVLIKGKVDANLESINGYAKFYKDPRTGQYYVVPVTDPYE